MSQTMKAVHIHALCKEQCTSAVLTYTLYTPYSPERHSQELYLFPSVDSFYMATDDKWTK